jgi:hypothetical protein
VGYESSLLSPGPTRMLREQQPVVPPHVDYSLTDRGRELSALLLPLMNWIIAYARPQPATAPPLTRPHSRSWWPAGAKPIRGLLSPVHTTVEDHATDQPEIRQIARSEVPSGELHPSFICLTFIYL